MQPTIRFVDVSKRYRLGLTRTSLPTLITRWAKRPFTPHQESNENAKYLWALENVNFELMQGQSLALIGPNGAGKTTILKLLARITKPTSGHIETNGKLSALIELGAGFHPDLTGRENIFLNGTILGLRSDEIRNRFDEIVAFSELEKFLDTPLKRYSSGMSVRLGFSVAACIEPEILLVDEVLAVGDASFRQKCLERIQELTKSGTSLIFVSHSMWLVQAVCENALYIDHGHVKYRGKTSEVVNRYDQDLNEMRARKFLESHSEGVKQGDDLEITAIEITGANQGDDNELQSDRTAEINIQYLAYRSFEDINAVVRVLRTDGVTCCMMRTSLDNFQFNVPKGSGVLSVTIDPLQLTGGTYYIQVIFKDSTDSYSIASNMSKWFYVSNMAATFTFSSMNGVFEPARKWDHYQTEMNIPSLTNTRVE